MAVMNMSLRVEGEMQMHGGVFGLRSPVGCAQGGDDPCEGVVEHGKNVMSG